MASQLLPKYHSKGVSGKILILIFCFFLVFGFTCAQPAIERDSILPGVSFSVPTKDGGRVVKIQSPDYRIVKYNAAHVAEWDKSYRGKGSDYLISVIETSDGGYLLGGISDSNAGLDKSENSLGKRLNQDYWVVKISANGTKQWDRTLGGLQTDQLTSLLETSEGGFLVGGISNSPSSIVKTERSRLGSFDYWIVKLNASGTIQWDKVLGGDSNDNLIALQNASDGGILLAGVSSSAVGYEKTAAKKGYTDGWIVKMNADGTKQWDITLGGPLSNYLSAIQPAADGGFVVGFTSNSNIGADKAVAGFGSSDYWIVKVNAAGIKQWERVFGGNADDSLISLTTTPDGGFLLGGHSQSIASGSKTAGKKGGKDLWVIKTDANGNKIWEKTLGGTSKYTSYDLLAATAPAGGGYVIQGRATTDTPGGDKTVQGTGFWEIVMLSELNKQKLNFSKSSISFIRNGTGVVPASGVTIDLAANTGNPKPRITKTDDSGDWLVLPKPALGALSFKTDFNTLYGGTFKSLVVATAPGYERTILNASLVVYDLITPPGIYGLDDQLVTAGQLLTFRVQAVVKEGQNKIFSLVGAPAGVAIDAVTGVVTWVPEMAGVYDFKVSVTASESPLLTSEAPVKVTVLSAQASNAIRINAGGGRYTTTEGKVFEADKYYSGIDRTSVRDVNDIANTPDDDLYNDARASEQFEYNIPVKNGIHRVVLHFAEVYWGVDQGRPGPNRRVFNISAENVKRFAGYDIFNAAGGALKAVQLTFDVSVSDGLLDLNFFALQDKARVSAIEVIYQDASQIPALKPVADAYVREGIYANSNFGTETTLETKAGGNTDLSRSTYIKFSLNDYSEIRNARFRIYGYNHESVYSAAVSVSMLDNDNWTETGINAANAPTGLLTFLKSIPVDGTAKYFDVDVTTAVQQQFAKDKVISFLLRDSRPSRNRIIFNSRENEINPPQLVINDAVMTNAIARTANEAISSQESDVPQSVIFPNPVTNQFNIRPSVAHSDNVSVAMVNLAGNNYAVKTDEALRPGRSTTVHLSEISLSEGLYLIKVQSSGHSEVLKIFITK